MSSAATPFPAITGKAINWTIALSILLILAGLFALFIPFISGIGITLFIGWLLILSGCLHFVFAFKSHTTGSVLWEILLGIVYLFAGVYLIMHPLAGLITLTLFLAIYLCFEGILEIIQSFQIRPRHGSGWLLFDGIITLILAILIWRSWPSSTVWVIGTLVGISMIFSGFSRLMLAFAAKRALHHLTQP